MENGQKKCSSCGADLENGAVFCKACGARQSTSREVKTREIKRRCGKSVLIFLTIAYAFCAICVLAFAEMDRDPFFVFIFLLFTGASIFSFYQYKKRY